MLHNNNRPAVAQNRWPNQRFRQSASESPRALPRFQHNHQALPQPIKEEDERLTPNCINMPNPHALLSKLPKPGHVANLKKSNGWLNRLKLNVKKS